MKTNSVVPLSALGVVRNHAIIAEFAGILVRMGATSLDGSVRVGQIRKESDIDRKGIYNRLSRPGFVKVDNGPSAANTYYYLFNEGFGDLARSQDEKYYPQHLGPLATSGTKIPSSVTLEGSRYLLKPEVTGTMSTSIDDAKPLLIRAVGVDDALIISQSALKEAGPLIIQLLENPIGQEITIDNALVLLGGIKRWLQHYNEDYDVEKQTYIKEALERE